MRIAVIAILVAIPAVILGTGIWLVYIQPFVRRLWQNAKDDWAAYVKWLDGLDPETLADLASAMPMSSWDPLYPTSSFIFPYTERPTLPRAQASPQPSHLRPT